MKIKTDDSYKIWVKSEKTMKKWYNWIKTCKERIENNKNAL